MGERGRVDRRRVRGRRGRSRGRRRSSRWKSKKALQGKIEEEEEVGDLDGEEEE